MAKKRQKTRRLSSLKPRLQEAASLKEALALHQAGNYSAAKDIYSQIIKQNPKNGDALNLAGALALQKGELPQAVHLLQKAVKYYPSRTAYYVNLGAAFRAKGDLHRAAATFKKALRLSPSHHESLYNLASVLSDEGDFAEATTLYRKILDFKPRHTEALLGLITALRLQGALQEALELCSKLRDLQPPEQVDGLEGELLQIMGRYEESLAAFKRAIARAPDNGIFCNNMANTLVKMGRLQQALPLYQKAISAMPNLGNAYINLAWIYREFGMLPESRQCFCELQKHAPLSAEDHSDLLFSLNYDPAFDNQAMYEEAQKWWMMHGQRLHRRNFKVKKLSSPIKIGFISPDFLKHPVGQFMLPLLKGLPHDRIDSFCYASLRRPPDELTFKLQKAAGHWRDITPLNDQGAAALIAKDKIDILFDLAGHTAHSRLGVMSRKPAPIQVSWLGYVNTTGLPVIDYRLTDEIADPPGAEIFYSESLYRLPHGFFCFTPPEESPEITAPPVEDNGITTFASFNNLPKITPEVVKVWAAILNKLPQARLLMVSRQFAEPAIAEHYKNLFKQQHIDDNQIVFHGSLPYLEYLALFNQVDIALDPFPHNGHTITCDTLWMGVPVITLCGNCYAGRMGSSIMTRIGLADLIARDRAEYIDLSLALAKDTARLKALRFNMRKRLLTTICNNKQFCRDFEQAVVSMVGK